MAKGRRSTVRRLPRDDAPGVRLSKREIVRRELSTAIRLYLNEGDPVAVHVLTSAASEILHAVAKANGVKAHRQWMRDHIRDEYQEEFFDALSEPYNFMKHGARDAYGEVLFNEEQNGLLLTLTCEDYRRVFNATFLEMNVLAIVMQAERPDLYQVDAIDDDARRALSNLTGASRVDRAAGARALAIADDLAGKGLLQLTETLFAAT